MPIFNSKSWPLAIKLSLTITAVVTVVGFMIGTVMVLQEWSRFHEELGEREGRDKYKKALDIFIDKYGEIFQAEKE